ncbi:hypothetical protein L9F63_000604, partial [Diploptera punctata]
MDVVNIVESSQRPYIRNLTAKPSLTKLTIAGKPSENDVFDQPSEEQSYPDSFTTTILLGNGTPASTTLPSYYNDIIVGRITCNSSANGTLYTSLLDCYNDSFIGGIFGNGSGNGSAVDGSGGEEPLSDVILMGVTSVILGLMILITVI